MTVAVITPHSRSCLCGCQSAAGWPARAWTTEEYAELDPALEQTLTDLGITYLRAFGPDGAERDLAYRTTELTGAPA